MRFQPRRSSPRLPSFSYEGSHTYHLVLTTRNRLPWFRDRRLVASCLECLVTSAARYEFDLIAYCFMPNHLHLLVTGSENSPLVRFVQHVKQAASRRHRKLWQRSYYDHVLRKEEAIEEVAQYIWGNPVRAGLVEDVMEYPYSGPRELMAGYGEEAGEALLLRRAEDRAEAVALPRAEDRAKALSLQLSVPNERR